MRISARSVRPRSWRCRGSAPTTTGSPRGALPCVRNWSDEDGFDAALVQIVKSKARTLSAVAEAMGAVVPGGLILIDGAKEEGIEAVLKALKPMSRSTACSPRPMAS
jgi:16S rRNA G1207 methylase RsmC